MTSSPFTEAVNDLLSLQLNRIVVSEGLKCTFSVSFWKALRHPDGQTPYGRRRHPNLNVLATLTYRRHFPLGLLLWFCIAIGSQSHSLCLRRHCKPLIWKHELMLGYRVTWNRAINGLQCAFHCIFIRLLSGKLTARCRVPCLLISRTELTRLAVDWPGLEGPSRACCPESRS